MPGSIKTPAQPPPPPPGVAGDIPIDSNPNAGATGAAEAAAPAQPERPPAGSAPGKAKPKAYRNAGHTPQGAKFDPQQMQSYNKLSKTGIDPDKFYEATKAPKRQTGPYYTKIQESDDKALTKQYGDAILKEEAEYARSQGVSPKTMYARWEAEGLIPQGTQLLAPDKWPAGRDMKLPPLKSDVTPERLNRAHDDFTALHSEGLGANRAGRDGVVQAKTDRMQLVNEWKAAQTEWTGSNGAKFTPTEEQKNALLQQMGYLKHGRVTDFDMESARTNLFAGDGPDAKAKTPGSQGAEALTSAQGKLTTRERGFQRINDQLNSLPTLSEGDKAAILGNRTSLGGPLVDGSGKLRDDVTPDQLDRYSQALEERYETVRDLETRKADVQQKLSDPKITDQRRRSLEKSQERLDRQIERSKKTIVKNLRNETADSIRGEMPAHLKGLPLSDDQVVQVMNGNGYLGDNPELGRMNQELVYLKGLKTPQQKAEAKKEYLEEIQKGGYIAKPTGDSPEARRAQNIRVGLSKQGGYAQGGPGHGGAGGRSQIEDQKEMADYNQGLQHETIQFQDELAQAKENRDLAVKLDEEERQYERQMEMAKYQSDLQMEIFNKQWPKNIMGNVFTQTFGTFMNLGLQKLMSSADKAQDAMYREHDRGPIAAMNQGIANSLWPSSGRRV